MTGVPSPYLNKFTCASCGRSINRAAWMSATGRCYTCRKKQAGIPEMGTPGREQTKRRAR